MRLNLHIQRSANANALNTVHIFVINTIHGNQNLGSDADNGLLNNKRGLHLIHLGLRTANLSRASTAAVAYGYNRYYLGRISSAHAIFGSYCINTII